MEIECCLCHLCFFFQAEDGIRDLVRSRGLGDVYKRQGQDHNNERRSLEVLQASKLSWRDTYVVGCVYYDDCLLYTSDAADDLLCVDLGGRRIIKKKN